jgi:hypothetical protein
MKIVALTSDLMDRSKISAAIPGVSFELGADADVVIVDITKHRVEEVQAVAPGARLVLYGPHVDGGDGVIPRSRFFRDPAAACR